MGDSFADLLDVACTFVAQNDGERHPVAVQVLHREVGVADAAGDESNQDLVGTGRIDEDIAENGGFAGDFEQHCAGF